MLGIDTTSIILSVRSAAVNDNSITTVSLNLIASTALKRRDGTTCIHGPLHMTARVPILRLQAFSPSPGFLRVSAFNLCQPLPFRILGAKSLIVAPDWCVVSVQTVIAGQTFG